MSAECLPTHSTMEAVRQARPVACGQVAVGGAIASGPLSEPGDWSYARRGPKVGAPQPQDRHDLAEDRNAHRSRVGATQEDLIVDIALDLPAAEPAAAKGDLLARA